MILDTGDELVEFICPRCAHRWTHSYGLVHCERPSGEAEDYFTEEGLRVMSPYTPDGSPPCPRCASSTVGRLVARRPARRRAVDEGGANPVQRSGR